jgi:rare lipoprotein A (peptidoglycan hydrolase)
MLDIPHADFNLLVGTIPIHQEVRMLAPLNLAQTLDPLADVLLPHTSSTELQDSNADLIEKEVILTAFVKPLMSWHAVASVHTIRTTESISDTTLSDALLNQCTDLPALQAKPSLLSNRHITRSHRTHFQIWFKGHLIGAVSTQKQANDITEKLRNLLNRPTLDANDLRPVLKADQAFIYLGNELLLPVTPTMAQSLGYSPEWIALAWSNNLRQALQAAPLDMATVQMEVKGLAESDTRFEGTASWYGPRFHGRLTATGEIFNQNDLTVAHKRLPFGTILKVRNLENDRTVVVRVNDRGPYVGERSLDLSKAAAQCLGSEHAGVVPYEAVILQEVGSLEGQIALNLDHVQTRSLHQGKTSSFQTGRGLSPD